MAKTLFGTDGIRGRAGEFPLDDATVRLIGRALARTLASDLARPPRLLSGRDTRESGPRIEAALAAGVRDEGGTIESAGVITTPGVACATRLENYDAGIVVSASHNPYRDNGVKVFAPSGRKLADDAERAVEALVREWSGAGETSGTPGAPARSDGPSAANASPVPTSASPVPGLAEDSRHAARYLDYLRGHAAGGLDLSGTTIVVDCANGAACELAPELFASLGARVHAIGVRPDGRNINEGCGSLHLEALGAEVVARGADMGVAFDGDADRALFVDASGTAVDGDAAMYVLALDLLERGALAERTLVATMMSNVGLEIALRERGVALVRTPVGDKSVLDELLRGGAALGGEQSGHVIFPAISLAGDGMVTAIELFGAVRRAGRPLADLVAGMRRYPQVLLNVHVREKRPFEEVPEIAAAAADVERDLVGSGRLLLRYSGTENLARVMIEGEDLDRITAQAESIASAIRAGLG